MSRTCFFNHSASLKKICRAVFEWELSIRFWVSQRRRDLMLQPLQKWYLMWNPSDRILRRRAEQLKKHDLSTIRKYNTKRTDHFRENGKSLHYPSFELHENVNENSNFNHFLENVWPTFSDISLSWIDHAFSTALKVWENSIMWISR